MEIPKANKQYIFISATLLFCVLLFFVLFYYLKQVSFRKEFNGDNKLVIAVNLKSKQNQTFQLFYTYHENFSAEQSLNTGVIGKDRFQEVSFSIPDMIGLKKIRFDMGTNDDTLRIKSLALKNRDRKIIFSGDSLAGLFSLLNQCQVIPDDSLLRIKVTGSDPYLSTTENFSQAIKIIIRRDKNPFIAFIASIVIAIFVFFAAYDYLFLQKDATNNSSSVKEKISRQKTSFLNWVVIAFFVLLLLLPAFLQITNDNKKNNAGEKRKLAELPTIGFETACDFPDKFSAWFNDHFGGRNFWVKCHSYIKTQFFNISPLPEKVMLGKDGWLFFADENIPQYYRNAVLFSSDDLEKIKQSLEERSEWCRRNGAFYYLLLPPMSSSIYPEYLPDFIKKENHFSCLDQVAAYLKQKQSTVAFIDIRNDLLLEKKKRMVYYKTDFHWNIPGAFLAYQKLAGAINKDTMIFKIKMERDYKLHTKTAYDADLALLLNLPEIYSREVITMVPRIATKANPLISPAYPSQELFKQAPVIYGIDSSNLPLLVMFRDSYGNYLIPFLSEHFSRSCYIWTDYFIPDIVSIEKPLIVIQEINEKNIYDLLLKNPEEMKEDLIKSGK